MDGREAGAGRPFDAAVGAGGPGVDGAAHRVVGAWLLASAPLLLARVLAGAGEPVYLALLVIHLLGGGALILATRRRVAAPAANRSAGVLMTWLPLMIAPAFYWEVPLLAQAIHGGAFYDSVVLAWEAAAFGGQPSQSLSDRWPWLWVSEPLHAAYLSFYFFVILPPVGLEIAGRARAAREMMFTIVLVAVAHALAFVAFPVLGPRFLFPAPAGPIADGPLFRLTHYVLERGSSPGTAFPSSHVGLAVAVTVALARSAPRAAAWVGAVAAALALSTVYGGFHYAVDAFAGAALGGALAFAAPAVQRWTRPGRPVYRVAESKTTWTRRNVWPAG